MTLEIAVVYALIGLALVLFAYERVRIDATATLMGDVDEPAGERTPYLTEVVLGAGAAGVGEAVADNVLVRNLDVDIIEVVRSGEPLSGSAGQLG